MSSDLCFCGSVLTLHHRVVPMYVLVMSCPPEGEAEGAEQGESIEAMSSWRSRALGGQVSPADSLGSLGAVSEHAPAVGQGTQGTQALAALTRQHQTWLGANRT